MRARGFVSKSNSEGKEIVEIWIVTALRRWLGLSSLVWGCWSLQEGVDRIRQLR